MEKWYICSHLYIPTWRPRVHIVLLSMETWFVRILTSYSQHSMHCICTIQLMFTIQQPFLLLSGWAETIHPVVFLFLLHPYSIQITILIFHISACIYQCISNRWKKLHQLIMEAVQGRSILDITRGFELQP